MHNPEWTSHGAPSGRSHGVDFLISSSVTPRFFVPCELPLCRCISNGTQPERFFFYVGAGYRLITPFKRHGLAVANHYHRPSTHLRYLCDRDRLQVPVTPQYS